MTEHVTCPICGEGDVEVEVQPREPSVGIMVAYIIETYPCESCGGTPSVEIYHDVMMDELTSWPQREGR